MSEYNKNKISVFIKYGKPEIGTFLSVFTAAYFMQSIHKIEKPKHSFLCYHYFHFFAIYTAVTVVKKA